MREAGLQPEQKIKAHSRDLWLKPRAPVDADLFSWPLQSLQPADLSRASKKPNFYKQFDLMFKSLDHPVRPQNRNIEFDTIPLETPWALSPLLALVIDRQLPDRPLLSR